MSDNTDNLLMMNNNYKPSSQHPLSPSPLKRSCSFKLINHHHHQPLKRSLSFKTTTKYFKRNNLLDSKSIKSVPGSIKSWKYWFSSSVKSPAIKAVKAVKSAMFRTKHTNSFSVSLPYTAANSALSPSDLMHSDSSDISLVLSVSNSSSPCCNPSSSRNLLLPPHTSSSSMNIVRPRSLSYCGQDSDHHSSSSLSSISDSEYNLDHDSHSVTSSIFAPTNLTTPIHPAVHIEPTITVPTTPQQCTPTLLALDLPHDPITVTVTDGRLHPLPPCDSLHASTSPTHDSLNIVPGSSSTLHTSTPTSALGPMVRRHSISSPEYHQVFHGIFGWSFAGGRPDFPPVRVRQVEPHHPDVQNVPEVVPKPVPPTNIPLPPLVPDVYGVIWRLVDQTHRVRLDMPVEETRANIRHRRRKAMPLTINPNHSDMHSPFRSKVKDPKIPFPGLIEADHSNRSSMLESETAAQLAGTCIESMPPYSTGYQQTKCPAFLNPGSSYHDDSPGPQLPIMPDSLSYVSVKPQQTRFLGANMQSIEDVAIFMSDQRRLRRTELALQSRMPIRFVADPSPLCCADGNCKTSNKRSGDLLHQGHHVMSKSSDSDIPNSPPISHSINEQNPPLIETPVLADDMDDMQYLQELNGLEPPLDVILPKINLPNRGFSVPELESNIDVFAWALHFGSPLNDPATCDDVQSASPLELVRRLTEALDYEYLEDFFVVYRLFMDPLHLAKLLMLRMRTALPIPADTSTCQLIRMRTGVVLRHWIKHYFEYDFADNKDLRRYMGRALKMLTLIDELKEHEIDARTIKALKRMWISRTNKYVKRRSRDSTPVSPAVSVFSASGEGTMEHISGPITPKDTTQCNENVDVRSPPSSSTMPIPLPPWNQRMSRWSMATNSSYMTRMYVGGATSANEHPSSCPDMEYLTTGRLSNPRYSTPSISADSFETFASPRCSRMGSFGSPWTLQPFCEKEPVNLLDDHTLPTNPLRPIRLSFPQRSSLIIPAGDSAMASSPRHCTGIGSSNNGWDTPMEHYMISPCEPKPVIRQDSAIQVPVIDPNNVSNCNPAIPKFIRHASLLSKPDKDDDHPGHHKACSPAHVLFPLGLIDDITTSPQFMGTGSPSTSMDCYPNDSRCNSITMGNDIVRQAVGKLRLMFKVSSQHIDPDLLNEGSPLHCETIGHSGTSSPGDSSENCRATSRDRAISSDINPKFHNVPQPTKGSDTLDEPCTVPKSPPETAEPGQSSLAVSTPLSDANANALDDAVDEAAKKFGISQFKDLPMSALPNCSRMGKTPWMMTIRSCEVAQHLSIVDEVVVRHVDWTELLEIAVGRHPIATQGGGSFFGKNSNVSAPSSDSSDTVKAVIDRFNTICQWVQSQVLLMEDVTVRAKVIEKFIKIGSKCELYRNWFTLMAIMLALQSINISRLSRTWARVSSEKKALLDRLVNLTSPTRNFVSLRNAMEASPGLPFAGIYFSDLLFNNEIPSTVNYPSSTFSSTSSCSSSSVHSDIATQPDSSGQEEVGHQSIQDRDGSSSCMGMDHKTSQGLCSKESEKPLGRRFSHSRSQRAKHRSLIQFISLAKRLSVAPHSAPQVIHKVPNPIQDSTNQGVDVGKPENECSSSSLSSSLSSSSIPALEQLTLDPSTHPLTEDTMSPPKAKTAISCALEASSSLVELEDDIATIVNWQKYKVIAKVVRKFKTFLESPSYDALYKWELRNEIFWHSVFLDRQVLEADQLTRRSNLYEPSQRISTMILSP